MSFDWTTFLTGAAGAGISTAVVGPLIWLLASKYFSAYLSEKGKNLATKEDIAGITNEVERVRHTYAALSETLKHQNALLIEDHKTRGQLRLAALDQRMAAHQHSFTLWRRMRKSAHEEHADAVVAECQAWWESNFLYLEPAVRTAFAEAYWARAFKLPALTETEHKAVGEKDPKPPAGAQLALHE